MATGKTCCCGCCSVRDGTRVIAVLGIIGGVGAIWHHVRTMMGLAAISSSAHPTHAPGYGTVRESELETWVRDHTGLLTAIMVIALLISLLETILCGMLLYGANNNKESACRPWLIFNYVTFAILVLIGIAGFIFVCVKLGAGLGFLVVLILALVLGIRAYFIKVVYDFRQELREDAGASAGAGGAYTARV